MRQRLIVFFSLVCCYSFVFSQPINYQDNENLKYRVHYGLISSGYASLQVKSEKLNGRPVFHVIGKGWTSRLANAFFKVNDRYETFIDSQTVQPLKFIRKIEEGGYKKNKELHFNHLSKSIIIKDLKKDTTYISSYRSKNIQDMLSAFYYLRGYDLTTMKAGEDIMINMFFDDKQYSLKLKILGREKKKTEFGYIDCVMVRPYVQSGRVFKEEESLTIWITDDQNHIPVTIKAQLMVGSLQADLMTYKNLKYPIIFSDKH